VKWDDCINLTRYFNVPYPANKQNQTSDLSDGMHICDIDEEIERLQALKKAAIEYYATRGRQWPDG
jgi:hypothetical protein